MNIKLPEAYKERMQKLLGDEYAAYESTFERKYLQGLRVNPCKLSDERFQELWPHDLAPIAWSPHGFYAEEEWMASKHPYYYAGMYYLQEPSAMSPAAILPVEPGDRVLDLCAAPGGKSTQLAGKLRGEGVLVSNDISPSRAKALLKNLELAGSSNSVIVTEAPYKLAANFKEYFTKILVDAPCSGEGMFHKEPSIMKNWEQYGNEYYANLQKEILEYAGSMLAPGGMMVYSTCTFAPMEDEQSVQDFLDDHPDFHIIPIEKTPGMDDGHPEWIENGDEALKGCARLWPHRVQGQGHFVALLQREGELVKESGSRMRNEAGKGADDFYVWCRENLSRSMEEVLPAQGTLRLIKEHLILDPLPDHMLDGLRVLRGGLLLGEIKKNRFEPSQAWAMALKAADVVNYVDYCADDPEVIHYLKGETLNGSFANGWNLIGVDGCPLGWGKGNGSMLKNKYLKGWRYL